MAVAEEAVMAVAGTPPWWGSHGQLVGLRDAQWDPQQLQPRQLVGGGISGGQGEGQAELHPPGPPVCPGPASETASAQRLMPLQEEHWPAIPRCLGTVLDLEQVRWQLRGVCYVCVYLSNWWVRSRAHTHTSTCTNTHHAYTHLHAPHA